MLQYSLQVPRMRSGSLRRAYPVRPRRRVSGPDGVPGLNDQVLMEHIYALGKASKLDGRMHVAYSTVLGERDDVRAELRRVIVVKAALEQGALVMKKRDRAPGLVRSCEKMLRPIRWILSSVCSP